MSQNLTTSKKPIKKFEEMDDAEKRVAIARDVIVHLNLVKPSQGTYCYRSRPKGIRGRDSAQNYIDKISKDCDVCALGACFLSYIRLNNQVKVHEVIGKKGYNLNHVSVGQYLIQQKLGSYFTSEQLNVIESAFENYHCEDQCDEYDDLGKTPKARLRNIMRNIIKNKGEFIYD